MQLCCAAPATNPMTPEELESLRKRYGDPADEGAHKAGSPYSLREGWPGETPQQETDNEAGYLETVARDIGGTLKEAGGQIRDDPASIFTTAPRNIGAGAVDRLNLWGQASVAGTAGVAAAVVGAVDKEAGDAIRGGGDWVNDWLRDNRMGVHGDDGVLGEFWHGAGGILPYILIRKLPAQVVLGALTGLGTVEDESAGKASFSARAIGAAAGTTEAVLPQVIQRIAGRGIQPKASGIAKGALKAAAVEAGQEAGFETAINAAEILDESNGRDWSPQTKAALSDNVGRSMVIGAKVGAATGAIGGGVAQYRGRDRGDDVYASATAEADIIADIDRRHARTGETAPPPPAAPQAEQTPRAEPKPEKTQAATPNAEQETAAPEIKADEGFESVAVDDDAPDVKVHEEGASDPFGLDDDAPAKPETAPAADAAPEAEHKRVQGAKPGYDYEDGMPLEKAVAQAEAENAKRASILRAMEDDGKGEEAAWWGKEMPAHDISAVVADWRKRDAWYRANAKAKQKEADAIAPPNSPDAQAAEPTKPGPTAAELSAVSEANKDDPLAKNRKQKIAERAAEWEATYDAKPPITDGAVLPKEGSPASGEHVVAVPDQPSVPVRYVVVEADTLTNSDNEGSFPELQLRSQEEVSFEGRKARWRDEGIKPEYLGIGPTMTDGAPVVMPNGHAITNGRVWLAREANKDIDKDDRKKYFDVLEKAGFDRPTLEGMKSPVMVRVAPRMNFGETRQRMVAKANKPATVAKSTTEDAWEDAGFLEAGLDHSDNSTPNVTVEQINAPGTGIFAFINLLPSNDRDALTFVDKGGNLHATDKAHDRLAAAKFSYVFGTENGRDGKTLMAEASDPSKKTVAGAMIGIGEGLFPIIARVREGSVNENAHSNLDPTPAILDIYHEVKKLKHLKPEDAFREVLGQKDIFKMDTASSEYARELILRHFFFKINKASTTSTQSSIKSMDKGLRYSRLSRAEAKAAGESYSKAVRESSGTQGQGGAQLELGGAAPVTYVNVLENIVKSKHKAADIVRKASIEGAKAVGKMLDDAGVETAKHIETANAVVGSDGALTPHAAMMSTQVSAAVWRKLQRNDLVGALRQIRKEMRARKKIDTKFEENLIDALLRVPGLDKVHVHARGNDFMRGTMAAIERHHQRQRWERQDIAKKDREPLFTKKDVDEREVPMGMATTFPAVGRKSDSSEVGVTSVNVAFNDAHTPRPRVDTVLHEATHSAVYVGAGGGLAKINAYEQLPRTENFNEVKQLYVDFMAWLDDNRGHPNLDKDAVVTRRANAMGATIEESVTYPLTDPHTIDLMKSLEYDSDGVLREMSAERKAEYDRQDAARSKRNLRGDRPQTFWDKFVAAVLKMLGMARNKINTGMMDDILSFHDQYADAAMGLLDDVAKGDVGKRQGVIRGLKDIEHPFTRDDGYGSMSWEEASKFAKTVNEAAERGPEWEVAFQKADTPPPALTAKERHWIARSAAILESAVTMLEKHAGLQTYTSGRFGRVYDKRRGAARIGTDEVIKTIAKSRRQKGHEVNDIEMKAMLRLSNVLDHLLYGGLKMSGKERDALEAMLGGKHAMRSGKFAGEFLRYLMNTKGDTSAADERFVGALQKIMQRKANANVRNALVAFRDLAEQWIANDVEGLRDQLSRAKYDEDGAPRAAIDLEAEMELARVSAVERLAMKMPVRWYQRFGMSQVPLAVRASAMTWGDHLGLQWIEAKQSGTTDKPYTSQFLAASGAILNLRAHTNGAALIRLKGVPRVVPTRDGRNQGFYFDLDADVVQAPPEALHSWYGIYRGLVREGGEEMLRSFLAWNAARRVKWTLELEREVKAHNAKKENKDKKRELPQVDGLLDEKDDVDRKLADVEMNPVERKAFAEYGAAWDSMWADFRKLLVDSGLRDAQWAQTYANAPYAPFGRISHGVPEQGKNYEGKLSLLASLPESVDAVLLGGFKAARVNLSLRAMYKNIGNTVGGGRWMSLAEKSAPEAKSVLKAVEAHADDKGVVDSPTPMLLESMQEDLFGDKETQQIVQYLAGGRFGTDDGTKFVYLVDGKPRVVIVRDPMIVLALASDYNLGPVLQLGSNVRKVVQGGTTLNPVFALFNSFIRDWVSLYASSGGQLKGMVGPWTDIMRRGKPKYFYDENDPAYVNAMLNGALFGLLQEYMGDNVGRERERTQLPKGAKDKDIMDAFNRDVATTMSRMRRAYLRWFKAHEARPRITFAEARRKEGHTNLAENTWMGQAGAGDYRMVPGSDILKTGHDIVPWLSAAMRSMKTRIVDILKDPARRGRYLKVMGTMITVEFMAAMWNSLMGIDDDDESARYWARGTTFYAPTERAYDFKKEHGRFPGQGKTGSARKAEQTGGMYSKLLRIPTIYEVGIEAKMAVLPFMLAAGQITPGQALRRFGAGLEYMFIFDSLTPFDLFYGLAGNTQDGRAIVPAIDERTKGVAHTSRHAALNELRAPFAPSPHHIEAITRSWGGMTGGHLLQAFDAMALAARGMADGGAWMKKYLRLEPTKSSDEVSQSIKWIQKKAKEYATVKRLYESGREEQATTVLASLSGVVAPMTSMYGKFRQLENVIHNIGDMSPKAMRAAGGYGTTTDELRASLLSKIAVDAATAAWNGANLKRTDSDTRAERPTKFIDDVRDMREAGNVGKLREYALDAVRTAREVAVLRIVELGKPAYAKEQEKWRARQRAKTE